MLDELRTVQLGRLKAAVAHAWAGQRGFRTRCEAAEASPGNLQTLEDLRHFPFATKADFREGGGLGMLAVDRSLVKRFHASSGTTGKPTIVAYTQGDLETWRELVARSLRAAGARPGDLLHNAYGYGLFTGGLGLHEGAQTGGLTVIPASGGQSERQVQLIDELRPRIISCTPSYMLSLAETFVRLGVDPRGTSLEIGVHGAEPWSEEMRREIERLFGLSAYDIYGLSEIMGPGVAQERADAPGLLTIWEDHFLPEIVDPATGEPLPDGETGELVITALTREAMPVIRYRTGDLSRLHPPIGDLPHRRLDRIPARIDDMLIVRGVNLYPRQIEALVLETAALAPHYRIDLRREGALDQLLITVEPATGADVGECDAATVMLARRIKDRLGVTAEVALAAAGQVPRSEGKAKRVFDHRR